MSIITRTSRVKNSEEGHNEEVSDKPRIVRSSLRARIVATQKLGMKFDQAEDWQMPNSPATKRRGPLTCYWHEFRSLCNKTPHFTVVGKKTWQLHYEALPYISRSWINQNIPGIADFVTSFPSNFWRVESEASIQTLSKSRHFWQIFLMITCV